MDGPVNTTQVQQTSRRLQALSHWNMVFILCLCDYYYYYYYYYLILSSHYYYYYYYYLIIIDNFIKKTIKIPITINSLKKKNKLFIQKHYLQFLSI